MGDYARRSEAALASFMEKFQLWHGARSVAAARLNQFRGLPANGGLPGVDDGRLADTPTNVDRVRIVAAAERAVADRLHVESVWIASRSRAAR
jgi:hypothetical protein